MKNNRFLSFALCALFAFVPFSVDALVFKNGEDVISLSERDISCVKEKLNDGFRNVGSLEDNFVFTDNYEEDYVKVTVEGKCESLTLEEILSFRKPHVGYYLDKEDDKYFLIEEITNFNQTYYIKTKDTEIDLNKTYYTIVDGYREESVLEPKTSELGEYYEQFYFKHYDNTEIDLNLTYYKRVGDTIEVEKVDEDKVKEQDIQYYYVEVSDSQESSYKKIQEIIKKTYDSIDGSYSIIKHPETGEYYIENNKYIDNDEDFMDMTSIYDIEGNLIYKDIESFIPLNNSLYFVQKLEENQGDNDSIWSFDVYDGMGTDANLLTTINDIRFVTYEGYKDYNSLLYGYIYDEEKEEEFDKYYDLRVYKVLEEASSVFDGSNNITIKTSGNVKNVDKIYVNDNELGDNDFTLESGSTIVTLKNEYLNTLENDTYDLKITYNDGGYVETTFEVEKTNADVDIVKVTLDANGGKFNDTDIYTIENWDYTLYDTLVKPTREGYKFKGYYTEKNDGTKLEMILNEAGIDSDMTFYAQWEKEENVPQTFDGITNSVLVATLSLIGLVGAIYLKIKQDRA